MEGENWVEKGVGRRTGGTKCGEDRGRENEQGVRTGICEGGGKERRAEMT